MKKKNQTHIHNQAPPATAMDLRKHPFLDHFLAAMPSKRRVLCVFVLGVAASFCVVSLLASMNSPAAVWSSPSSLFTCFFSASRCIHFTRSNDSSSSAVSSNSSLTDNNAAASQGGTSASGSGNGTSLSEALEGNFSRPISDSGSVKSHQWSSPNSSISNTDAINKTLFDKIHAGSPCAEVNKSVSGNLTSRDACATPSAQTGTKGEVTSGEHESFRNSSSGNFNESNAYVKAVDGFSLKKCDIYDGRWVRDLTKPHYPPGSCPYIDVDFDCFKNGRPDDEFLRWKWKPYGCDIPSLNATDFLKRLRGNRILFVGDSLNRNMWESLVCILHNSIKNKSRVFEVSGRREFKMQGYYSFRFEDYMCSIDFVRSPFLVKEQFLKTANGSEDERLRLDLLDETKAAYLQADIVVFNSGHWWTHEKTSSGIRYYQEGNYVYPVLEVLKAYEKALNTWAGWVDRNIDSNKTQIVFRGYSLTHFRGGQWNSGGQCHKEIEPIYNETFINKYPEKMIALEGVLHKMETPVLYLNISRLTDYRKDGHPSIYRKKYSSAEEHVAAEKIQDCSHWCLPGVPDTWNELLYASLLMEGKGPWKQ